MERGGTGSGDVVRSPSVRAVRRGVLVWLVSSAVGAAVIALPDSDRRVFSFSHAHGPSLVDLLGVLVMLVGWMLFLRVLWVVRREAGPTGRGAAAPFVIGVGAGLLVASVTGFPLWWLVGAVLLIAGQLMIASSFARPSSRTTE